jgi:hypothetical protein
MKSVNTQMMQQKYTMDFKKKGEKMDGLLTQGNDEQKEVQLLSSQMQKT